MCLCQPEFHILLHPLWKPEWSCVLVFMCPCHPACGPTPWLKCIHGSVHVYMSTWLPISAAPSMHSLMETWNPCVALCICHNHPTSSHTPWLECVHASVHVFMPTWLYVRLTPPTSYWRSHLQLEIQPLNGGPTSKADPSSKWRSPLKHSSSVPTPWLECVYASVHIWISAWFLLSTPPLLHSLHANMGDTVWQWMFVAMNPLLVLLLL